MAIQMQGNGGTVAEVESNSRALRQVNYPVDDGSLGTYSLAYTTGTIAAGIAGSSEIFQFRWTSSNLALIQYISVSAGNTATAFTAGVASFNATIARSWTVAGTGGTQVVLASNDSKLRASMATSVLNEARISTTAALGAGTKTLDATAFAATSGSVVATAGTVVLPYTVLWNSLTGGEYPIALAANEGFVIRCTVPATGTWTASVQVKWVEVASYAP